MPTKNVPFVARTANRDLEAKFYFGNDADSPPNTLRVRVFVTADNNGTVQTFTFDSAVSALTSLTGPQRAALRDALLAVRDEAVTALGFT